MTQDQFDKLPGLLSLSQFMAATGLTTRKVRDEREAGVIGTHRAAPKRGRKRSYPKYFKRDAARVGGFHLR